jgi:hypothetical protein
VHKTNLAPVTHDPKDASGASPINCGERGALEFRPGGLDRIERPDGGPTWRNCSIFNGWPVGSLLLLSTHASRRRLFKDWMFFGQISNGFAGTIELINPDESLVVGRQGRKQIFQDARLSAGLEIVQ